MNSNTSITITPDSLTNSPDLNINDMLQLTTSAQLAYLKQAADAYPEDEQDLYDAYNMAVSQVLQEFAPHLELRPDLTADAIMRMEDQILEEHQTSDSQPTEVRLPGKLPLPTPKTPNPTD